MNRAIALTSQDWVAKGATAVMFSNGNKATMLAAYVAWLNTATAGTAKSVINLIAYHDGEEHNLIVTYYLEQIDLIPGPRYGRFVAEVPAS